MTFRSTVGTDLFQQFLFPACRALDTAESSVTSTIPLLHAAARRSLYDIIFELVKDNIAEYHRQLSLLQLIVPYGRAHSSSTVDGTPYFYKLEYAYERRRTVRSETGYVGLANFGSTCYINSLLTQLFMNIDFRRFMLSVKPTDSDPQTLLVQTQNVFAHMQNSYNRYIEPVGFIESIRTYDSTPIDVNIQMDADEFYNLLFDRWESQMTGPENTRQFHSFYGGQLIQQIKSKECEHISSRLEPFSAIQCDIKGKSTLHESLKAYVEGEIMEGDNKYKCETCNRHVDAVKRTCLKDVPDNLIFHLKRFAYSVRTGMRSKINDFFDFPRSIDM